MTKGLDKVKEEIQNYLDELSIVDLEMVNSIVRYKVAQAVQEALEEQKDRYEQLLGMEYEEAVESIKKEALLKERGGLVEKIEKVRQSWLERNYKSWGYEDALKEVIDLIKDSTKEEDISKN